MRIYNSGIRYIALLICLILVQGCCQKYENNPQKPSSLRGWQEYRHNDGIPVMGEFLLKEGESVENGKLGVQLLKIITPTKCSDPFAENDLIPKATLRIFDVQTNQTLLQVTVKNHTSYRLINDGFNSKKYKLDGLFPKDINTTEKWIWLELWS